MTVAASQPNRYSYAGDGASVAFAYSSKFLANADLVVLLVDNATGVESLQTITTHYTVTGAGDAGGGTVTFVAAPAVGKTIVIYGDPVISQLVDPVNGDNLNVDAVIESPLDKLTIIARRHKDRLDRTMRQPDGDTANAGALPPLTQRRGKFLAFDATTGDPIASTGSGTPTSATMAPVVNAATTGDALTLLGFSTFVKTTIAAATAAAFRALLGSSVVGDALFTAASAAMARATIGVINAVNNLLPNTNWQMMAIQSGTHSAAMSVGGTTTVGGVSYTGFTVDSSDPNLIKVTFATADTGALFVGQLFTVNTAGFPNSALRVSKMVTNTSFSAIMPLGIAPPGTAAGAATPLGVGDITATGTPYLADGWSKATTLYNWPDDYAANRCPGAKRVMGLRKGVAAVEIAGTDLAASNAEGSLGNIAALRGRTITFGALVWQKVQGGAGTWTLRIDDSAGASRSAAGAGSAYADATYGGYEFISVTRTIDANATGVAVYLELNGAVGDVYYFAVPTLVVGPSLTRESCGPNPQEILKCTHWNPTLLTPLAMTLPAAAFPGTGGALWGFSGASVDIGAMSYGAMHNTVKAVKAKIELDIPFQGGNCLFTGSSLTGPLMFGPQQYTPLPSMLPFTTALVGIADGVTTYLGPAGANATEAVVSIRVPFACRVVGMSTQTPSTAAGARTYTVMKNGVATTMTSQAVGAATQSGDSAVAHWVTLAAGDTLSVRLVTSGGSTNVQHQVVLTFGSIGAGIAAQGWWPLDPNGNGTLFANVASMEIANATFDFDAVQL